MIAGQRKILRVEYANEDGHFEPGWNDVVSIDTFQKSGEYSYIDWIRITFEDGQTIESPMGVLSKVFYSPIVN